MSATSAVGPERQLFDAAALAQRWGVSPFSVRRLMKIGSLHSITIGARRMVPLGEVQRAEQYGVGQPRTRKVAQ